MILRRLIPLIVIAIGAYYAWTAGLPWLQERLTSSTGSASTSSTRASEEDGDAAACVAAATEARDAFAGEIAALGPPPVDPQSWTTVLLSVGGRLTRADDACACAAPACERASEAVRELRDMLSSFGGARSGDYRSFDNPATRLERVDELLAQARSF